MSRVLAVALMLCSFSVAGAVPGEPKRVLMLHSFGQDFVPYSDLAVTFRDELTQKLGAPVDLIEVSLMTVGSGPALVDAPFVQYLQALLVGRKPDLVVAVGGPAANFTQRQRQQLFPGTPTVYAAMDQRTLDTFTLTDHDTVLASDLDVHGFVQNILDVLPDTTHVAVVLGASPVEKYWMEEMRRAFQPFRQIEFMWLDKLPFEQMKRKVADLPPHSAVLYGLLMVDAEGVPRTLTRGLQDIHDSANAPIFGVFSSNVDRGVVGGRLVSDAELGRNTAKVAIRVLHGESPGTIKTPPQAPGAPLYNWRELQRWNIPESSLPAGSLLKFREPSVWERYQPYLLVAATILLIQTGLIVGFVWQRLGRRRAERETATLSGRLLMVHENERRRIARELHDDITQRLAALAIESARHGTAQSVREGLVSLSEDVHALSYRLHPSVIEDLGLVEALKAECERIARTGSVAVSFDAQDIPKKLSQDAALCLFRIAQEALRNVVRHAGASAVQVSLAPMEDGLHLAVSDNGAGFDMYRHNDHPSLGLASMRERVNLLQGEVDIESTLGHGTTVMAWIPLQALPA